MPGRRIECGAFPDQRRCTQPEAAVITICVLTSAAALAWLYLLCLHGGYWRPGHRLPRVSEAAAPLPAITAVIPARNEADMLPASLPSLLAQDYPGPFNVIVVDDDSTDDTAKTAAELGPEAGWQLAVPEDGQQPLRPAAGQDRQLIIVSARATPPGWAGKVWAMSEGVRAVRPDTGYILFTDADIAYRPGTLTALAAAAGGGYEMVSQMALLRTGNRWERLLIPAFVYFFAQLYPFPRVSRARSKTAAAAGGCMLVRAAALTAAGGLGQIRGARIDDVALGTLLKRAGAAAGSG